MVETPELNDDFVDLLRAFTEAGVDFLVVGAHALAAHGVVRATGDLDVLVRPDPENAVRVLAALRSFGAPVAAHGIAERDFAREGTVYQLGLPPRRIDVLTRLSGVDFDRASRNSVSVRVGSVAFEVPDRQALLLNKRASGRPKDLEDARLLELLEPE